VPEGLSSRRLVTTLVSFVDDYEGDFPREHFDEARVRWMLDHLERGGGGRTIPDLLAARGCASCASFVEAILVLHATLRQLARGRDNRALPSCAMDLDTRLRVGAKIAPFPEHLSRGGDPLGDAYHYTANLAVGVAFRPHAPATWWPVPLFACGPELMWIVRQELFGAYLFFGNHARIDRLGLAHGLALGARAWGAATR
jgi:hypothetical protein